MKKDLVKKVTQWQPSHLKVYYYQIGQRTFSMSVPGEFGVEEIKNVLKELSEKIEDAPKAESQYEHSIAVLNAFRQRELLDVDLEGVEEEAQLFELDLNVEGEADAEV